MIIVRCENIEGIYTPRMAYENYEEAVEQCNSIGMRLIENLNFSKFREIDIDDDQIPVWERDFWLDKTVDDLGDLEKEQVQAKMNSTKVVTSYHPSGFMECYSQSIAYNSANFSEMRTYVCADDMLTDDGKLKIKNVITKKFADDCDYLPINKTFLDSFGVSEGKNRLEANIEVVSNWEVAANRELFSILTPTPENNENITWCWGSPKPLNRLVATFDENKQLNYKLISEEQQAKTLCEKKSA
ncbi:Oidioi.mRNA.OKI2018_I69.chr2.g6174.t1.cds [Oikopleura dioica]|uniref:Oidioi.mRNA.OKI2018_I69.chr2.g6174.t1.cds n=1 Tax=Oikopleura dioica TaxID=34765 RepID=A0ABN7T281_OIKDI|nr:Oidioi.mRNA.OKI2018_I69.chr2.g6174.t1.cds [Oikopleura dioica]